MSSAWSGGVTPNQSQIWGGGSPCTVPGLVGGPLLSSPELHGMGPALWTDTQSENITHPGQTI